MKAMMLIVTGLVLAAGCNRQAPIGPPQVQYGQTECSQCGMTVNDEQYAAALILEQPTGERVAKIFDDIGCMLAFERESHDGKVLARYVKDYETHAWLNADRAAYVKGAEIHSPMGYGLLAAADSAAAERLALSKSGKVVDLSRAEGTPQPAAMGAR